MTILPKTQRVTQDSTTRRVELERPQTESANSRRGLTLNQGLVDWRATVNGTRTCSVDGCARAPRSGKQPLCETHYYRVRRTGTTDDRPRRVPVVKPPAYRRKPSACVVEDCHNIDCGPHGLCKKHYSRMLRHGSTDTPPPKRMPAREAHHNWAGTRPTYSGAHMRLRAQRGNAKNYRCSCGAQARQWAYLHNDPDELTSKFGAYSADPARYEAMCVSCHKRFDLARIAGES